MVANPAEGDSNIDIKEKTVLTDGYSYFCVDCAGDALPTPTPRP